MLIGYARVSTEDQNLNMQRDALEKAGCERIFEDHMTGSKIIREGLNEAIAFARPQDTIVVWRLDRLSRSLKDLIEMTNALKEKEIGLVSLHEAINTTTSTGNLIFHIFGALAEFEKNLIRERSLAGLAAARARGRVGGRKPKMDEAKIKMAQTLYDSRQNSIAEICEIIGVTKGTLYRHIKKDTKIS